jgi:hypothetical protein
MLPHGDSVPACLLAFQQTLIGCHEEPFLVPGIIGERRQSKGGRQAEVDPLMPKIGARADRRAHGFHSCQGFFTTLIRKDNDTFILTLPNDTIFRAKMRMDDLCGFLHDLLAEHMAVVGHHQLKVAHINRIPGSIHLPQLMHAVAGAVADDTEA